MRETSRTRHGRNPEAQGQIDLPPLLPPTSRLVALDLFAGIGGLSSGFARQGFSVIGVDADKVAGEVYNRAGFGSARQHDLASELCIVDVPVVLGGPPCRPWSAVNLQRRRSAHDDHGLLTRFVDHIREIRPVIFVMENVPALRSDDIYSTGMDQLRADGFDIDAHILRYDRFGSATRRRRLFTVGVRGSGVGAQDFFDILAKQEHPCRTVRDAIQEFRDAARDSIPDHDWSELNTIAKYRERYATGQYGWAKLEYDRPAPSFGSVAKTYILHPDAGVDGYPERVLSVREVLAIMDFDLSVRFPERTARAKRYQMVANAVSPQVSSAIAATVRILLTGTDSGSNGEPTNDRP